jgi:hypothetical protein
MPKADSVFSTPPETYEPIATTSAPGASSLCPASPIPASRPGAFQALAGEGEPQATPQTYPSGAGGSMTRRFLMNSIVALPLAGVATSSALAADALARPEASQDPDPIFAAIAAHEASLRALSVGLNVMYTLEEELPKELRKSNVDAWEEVIVETDDPRWIESEKNVHALFEADGDAAIGLINVEPATLAGLAALMRHVTEYERKGDSWPAGLEEDAGAKPTSIGKDWAIYLHRNIASLLERHA